MQQTSGRAGVAHSPLACQEGGWWNACGPGVSVTHVMIQARTQLCYRPAMGTPCLSQSQSLISKVGVSSPFFTELLCGLNEMVFVKPLA